jgi:F-type H+-transporting ATPase subunit b
MRDEATVMLKRIVLLAALVAGLALTGRDVLAAEAHAATPQKSAVEGASSHAGAAGGEGEVKPSLLPDPTSSETWLSALWVVIIFLVLLIVLYPTAWKQVLAGLKAREERIRRDIAEAEAKSAKAEETLQQYNAQLAAAEGRVREMIASAVVQGEKLAADIRQRAQQEAEEAKNRATREIEAAKKQALTEIYQRTAELSTDIAGRILRRSINAADQEQLVRESLQELQRL